MYMVVFWERGLFGVVNMGVDIKEGFKVLRLNECIKVKVFCFESIYFLKKIFEDLFVDQDLVFVFYVL